jgi:hypothetical protein
MNILMNMGIVGLLTIGLGMGACAAPADRSAPSDESASAGEATDDLSSPLCCTRCQSEFDDCTPPRPPPISNVGYCVRAYQNCISICGLNACPWVPRE